MVHWSHPLSSTRSHPCLTSVAVPTTVHTPGEALAFLAEKVRADGDRRPVVGTWNGNTYVVRDGDVSLRDAVQSSALRPLLDRATEAARSLAFVSTRTLTRAADEAEAAAPTADVNALIQRLAAQLEAPPVGLPHLAVTDVKSPEDVLLIGEHLFANPTKVGLQQQTGRELSDVTAFPLLYGRMVGWVQREAPATTQTAWGAVLESAFKRLQALPPRSTDDVLTVLGSHAAAREQMVLSLDHGGEIRAVVFELARRSPEPNALLKRLADRVDLGAVRPHTKEIWSEVLRDVAAPVGLKP